MSPRPRPCGGGFIRSSQHASVFVERSEGLWCGRGYRWVRPDERERIVVRLGTGGSSRDLALEFGCSTRTVLRIGEQAALAGRRVAHSPRWLSFEERERISRGIAAGESDSEIARALGRHRSTVGREIRAACAERGRYRALAAERKSRARGARPKATKLSASRRLLAAVEAGLERRWSPQQVSARLKLEHPDDGEMRISHETIYRSLYVQSRGELRRQLSANLRSGRGRRRARGRRIIAAGSSTWWRSPSARPRSRIAPSRAIGRGIC